MKVYARIGLDDFLEGIYSSDDLAKKEGFYTICHEINHGNPMSVTESRIRTILDIPNLDPCVKKLLEQCLVELDY